MHISTHKKTAYRRIESVKLRGKRTGALISVCVQENQVETFNIIEMDMERKFRNIIISSVNLNAESALILTHGGYTPKRNALQTGSGYVVIPKGITIEFNSEEHRPSIGTKASHLLAGHPISPIEIAPSGRLIHNYSLEHNPIFDRYQPNNTYDLIRVTRGKKAHIKDIFNAITVLGMDYKVIKSFHCRINKLTYDF